MAREYREFNFSDDIELMNLTYQMNTGNFMNYDNYENENLLNNEQIREPKIGL